MPHDKTGIMQRSLDDESVNFRPRDLTGTLSFIHQLDNKLQVSFDSLDFTFIYMLTVWLLYNSKSFKCKLKRTLTWIIILDNSSLLLRDICIPPFFKSRQVSCGINCLCAPADCFMCLWSPCCPSAVHAEEEPSVQPAEGGHCVVHGELQRLRQRQVSGCQGPAQGLGAGRLRSECCCVRRSSRGPINVIMIGTCC